MFYHLIYVLFANATISNKIQETNDIINERIENFQAWNYNDSAEGFKNNCQKMTETLKEIAEDKKGVHTIDTLVSRPTVQMFDALDAFSKEIRELTEKKQFTTVLGLTDSNKAMQLLRQPFQERGLTAVRVQSLQSLYESEQYLIEDCIKTQGKNSAIMKCVDAIKKKIEYLLQDPAATNKHVHIISVLCDIQKKLCDIDSILTIHVLINNSVHGIDDADFEQNMKDLFDLRRGLLTMAYEISLTIEKINMVHNISTFMPQIEQLYQAFCSKFTQSVFDRESIACAESLGNQHKEMMQDLYQIYTEFYVDPSKKIRFNLPSKYFVKRMPKGTTINPPAGPTVPTTPVSPPVAPTTPAAPVPATPTHPPSPSKPPVPTTPATPTPAPGTPATPAPAPGTPLAGSPPPTKNLNETLDDLQKTVDSLPKVSNTAVTKDPLFETFKEGDDTANKITTTLIKSVRNKAGTLSIVSLSKDFKEKQVGKINTLLKDTKDGADLLETCNNLLQKLQTFIQEKVINKNNTFDFKKADYTDLMKLKEAVTLISELSSAIGNDDHKKSADKVLTNLEKLDDKTHTFQNEETQILALNNYNILTNLCLSIKYLQDNKKAFEDFNSRDADFYKKNDDFKKLEKEQKDLQKKDKPSKITSKEMDEKYEVVFSLKSGSSTDKNDEDKPWYKKTVFWVIVLAVVLIGGAAGAYFMLAKKD